VNKAHRQGNRGMKVTEEEIGSEDPKEMQKIL
jgi:hypothetical protein